MIKESNKLRRRYQRNRDIEILGQIYEKNQEIQACLNSIEEEYWHNKIRKSERENKNIWKLMKSRKLAKNNNDIPQIIDENILYITDEDKLRKIGENLQKTNIMNREMAEEETTQLVENNIRSIRDGEFMLDEYQLTSPKLLYMSSKRNLQRMTKYLVSKAGLNNDEVYEILKIKVGAMSGQDKNCSICIDEISIKSDLFFDISKDDIIGLYDIGDF